MTLLVTGGAGFIGSCFIRMWLSRAKGPLINLDSLTYAGSLDRLIAIEKDPNYTFVHGDICDQELVSHLLEKHSISAVIHFAAESHVDRSIVLGPADFVKTNLTGTFSLLDASRTYWASLSKETRSKFRFLHISTDEVFGSLSVQEAPFTEHSPYRPNNPYAATKAGADHLVRSYFQTFDFPTLITHCSNNYGPFQSPEKLIPFTLFCALNGKPIPLYGDGKHIRDWLYVEDHCEALLAVLERGRVGESYILGSPDGEKENREVVLSICRTLDILKARSDKHRYEEQILFVKDRPGHDRRYASNPQKITKELNWKPRTPFEDGLNHTVQWFLGNQEWIEKMTQKDFESWVESNYPHMESDRTI